MTKPVGIYTLTAFALLVACTELPKEAYYKHGQPESLLTSTPEEARFDIVSKDDTSRIMRWVRAGQPEEASLRCRENSKPCNELEKMLRKEGVMTTRAHASHNSVTFRYDHVVARTCENRYIDNSINPYHLNHPTFGCSLASNSAQMVADKHQFTDPKTMGNGEARKGVQASDMYYTPSKIDTDFPPITTAESLATGTGSGR